MVRFGAKKVESSPPFLFGPSPKTYRRDLKNQENRLIDLVVFSYLFWWPATAHEGLSRQSKSPNAFQPKFHTFIQNLSPV